MRRTGSESFDQEFIGKIVGHRNTMRINLKDADLTQMMARTHASQAWKMSPGSAEPSTKRKPGMS